MSVRRALAGAALVAMATAGCPFPDHTLGTGGIAIGGGGGGTGADRLTFSVQPSSANVNEIITPAVRVQVLDSTGAPDSAFASSIDISIAFNPVGGNLSGTTSVAPVNGTASFGDLVISKSGQGYTLRATASGATSALSNSFTIFAP